MSTCLDCKASETLSSQCVSGSTLMYTHFHARTHNTHCHPVPVLAYPRITMHNSCSKVSSADKSQRLHLLFIENSSHDESFNKQTKHCTYFFFSCCLCFGIDLSRLISRDEDARRGEEWQGRER